MRVPPEASRTQQIRQTVRPTWLWRIRAVVALALAVPGRGGSWLWQLWQLLQLLAAAAVAAVAALLAVAIQLILNT